MGYSFNLTGSATYVALACAFVADIYKIHLDIGALATVMIVTLVASKGIANVPAGALMAGRAPIFDHLPFSQRERKEGFDLEGRQLPRHQFETQLAVLQTNQEIDTAITEKSYRM